LWWRAMAGGVVAEAAICCGPEKGVDGEEDEN
jgi:hypothetical protein